MIIKEILEFNKSFVEQEEYKPYITSKYPNKKTLILSCMDTRLTELLPAALGLKNGDVKMIKNAGGIVTHPFGSVMRSIIVAIYNLGVDEILVIGHKDCGVQSLDSNDILVKMQKRNISTDKIEFLKYCGLNFDEWLKGFDCVQQAVVKTVENIKNHPLIPNDVSVNGLLIDPTTGKLELIA
jgi:carbonic anhydrase